MDQAQAWRMARLGGDPTRVMELFPELDVIVTLCSSTMLTDTELRDMRNDGIITQDFMGRQIFKNRGLHDEFRVNLKYPDNVPREEKPK